MITQGRAARLQVLLDPLVERFDVQRRIAQDPVEAPRRYKAPEDQEVAGLLASCLAYGRADIFRPKLFTLLEAMGPSPAAFARSFDARSAIPAIADFSYRFHRGADVAALVAGAGQVLRKSGGLGIHVSRTLKAGGSLRDALQALSAEIRGTGRDAVRAHLGEPRALEHLLPDPARGSACKRLLLWARWMVRRDRVDVGAWEDLVPRSVLLIPLDTHVMRIARLLRLTSRSDMSWRTSEDVTSSLRLLDRDDPVRYDFTLCHLGMSGACPRKSRSEICRACPLQGACSTGFRYPSR